MKRLIIFLFLVIPVIFFGQNQHKSIHQLDLEFHNKLGYKTQAEWDKYNNHKRIQVPQSKGCKLNHVVFGWHPYWVGSAYENYQWSYLSDLAFFSYEVDPNDGSAVSMHGWESTEVVDTAEKHGVRVHLTATLFGSHDSFFANATAQQNLIDNLVTQVISRNANGINIDFEGMGSDNRDDFTAFIHNLATELHSQIPGSILSICLYAVDWSGVFDIPNLVDDVDLFIIMGYDYYYSGSSVAGPTGQLYKFDSFNYTQSRSVTYYLYKGVPHDKLVLGEPYYGMEWQTQSSAVPSNTVSYVSSRTYKVVKNNTSGYYSTGHIDPNCLAKYYVFQSGGNWYQTWCDDETTLKYSYKMVKQQGIAGIGIWALGYDDGYTQLWDLIRDYFSECAETPLTDTIWDLGGPTRAHYNNEHFIYTIQPERATNLTLSFSDFELETDCDSLYIYDGISTSAPLIGGYSGTTSPGTVVSSSNALTLEFFSDGGTAYQGWTAVWSGSADDIIPATSVYADDWQSENFKAFFSDSDNLGLKYKFYQVLDRNGSEWRANIDSGFVNDNFEETLNSEWHQIEGTWGISDQHLCQSDDALSNTNIYIDAKQDSGYIYLYHWNMMLSGTAGNRRGGIHFMCDDASQSNRHNNYMVYFRADQNKVQIYKYIDNNYYLKTNDDCNISADTWYDYKVIYNTNTGEIKAYQNNNLVSHWIDDNQITSGNAVSLRIGNAIGYFDDVKLYKNRQDTVTVTVGTNGLVRYQNPAPDTAACRIKSIVVDVNDNFSTLKGQDVNIDFTPPSDIATVNDGLSADVDTINTINQLSANWTESTDENSGIQSYWYAIGTSPLATDIVPWREGTSQTQITVSGLSLAYNTMYYISIKARNYSGLFGNPAVSDGVIIVPAAEPPVADFNYSESEICQGDSVWFSYTGENAENFLWIFNGAADIDTATTESVKVKYDSTGIFGATLIVGNTLGYDTLTIDSAIIVNTVPTVDFVADPLFGVIPLIVTFYVNAQNADNFLVDFGDGNNINSADTTFQHLYATTGTFSVTITAENEHCSAQKFKQDYIAATITTVPENTALLHIYPNPVSDILFIENIDENFDYQILNIRGKVIKQGKLFDATIDVNDLKSGVYILRLQNQEDVVVRKFIKI